METKQCTICKEEKPLGEFHKRYDRPGKNQHNSHCKSCKVEQVNKRRKEIKEKCVEYKGGKCKVCGYNKCMAALEFHHKDPSVKEYGINNSLTLSMSKLIPELDKCDLLCANCHREEHERLRLEE